MKKWEEESFAVPPIGISASLSSFHKFCLRNNNKGSGG